MIYGLLGDLTVGVDDRSLSLPRGHDLVVLGVLLINANRPMSTQDLLRAAWKTTNVVHTQLHKSVARLRKRLEQIERRDDLKSHPGFGYEMRIADNDLDMLRFLHLVQQADEARSGRRTGDEIGLRWEALRLWRGQHPLSNVPDNGCRREIDDLEQRRKRTAVRLFELEIGRRHYDRILGDLSKIAGYHPVDRRLCEQLMIVAHRSGYPTEAFAAYERHAAELDQSTGTKPDPVLRDLYYAINNGDEPAIAAAEVMIAPRADVAIVEPIALADVVIAPEAGAIVPRTEAALMPRASVAGGLNAAAPVRSFVDVPRQLRSGPADFVGRDSLVAEALWLLGPSLRSAVPVVVVPGPSAIGKTALALHVAHLISGQFPDGQLFVELRGNTAQPAEPAEVLAQLLRAFDILKVPETREERAALYRTVMAERRVLVVLDDARDEAQIRDLLPGNPACSVLVTARRRLPDIDGAHHVAPLEPLDPATAMELFRRVVARSGIDPDAEPEATEQVVALCAGLPLAVCIAAALRVRDFGRPTAELARLLAQQGTEALVYGDRSVARSIGAGFDQLDADARRLFLGLGLVGLPDVGVWTAAAVLDEVWSEAAGALLQLASSYMIQPAGPPMRYCFHDLTIEYAHRRAQRVFSTDGDRRPVFERVYRALLTLARRAHRGLYGGDFEVVHGDVADWEAPPELLAEVDRNALAWFEGERSNIRAAVGHCAQLGLDELCWDLAVSTHEFYSVAGYFDDWYATHTTALRACRAANNRRGEGVLLAILGQPALVASRRATDVSSPDDLQRAAELLAGDRHGQAIALRTLGNALRRRGELAHALTLFERALGGYEASADTVGRCQTLRFIGHTQLDLGNVAEARQALQTAKQIAQELGTPRLLAQTSYWIGQAHLAAHELAEAQAAFQVVLDVYDDEAPAAARAYAAHGFGDVACQVGDFLQAQRHLDMAAGLAREAADAALEGRVYLSIAALREAQGAAGDQREALRQAAACFAGCGAPLLEARARALLARHGQP